MKFRAAAEEPQRWRATTESQWQRGITNEMFDRYAKCLFYMQQKCVSRKCYSKRLNSIPAAVVVVDR